MFGYTDITPEWYSAYQSWWKDRHGFEMEKSGSFLQRVCVLAISSIVRKMTIGCGKCGGDDTGLQHFL